MVKTKIFFATDVHGSDKCFRKFLAAGNFYGADIIILSGDLTGKLMIPLVEMEDGCYKVDWPSPKVIKPGEELRKIESTIRDAGYYPYITNHQEITELGAEPSKQDVLFNRLMLERMREWCNLADEYLNGKKITCYISPGNDDSFEIDTILNESKRILNPDEKVVNVDGLHEMMTLGYSNVTPWKLPRDIPEAELTSKIEALVSQVKDVKNSIFNIHVPPYDSGLDNAPELDESFKMKSSAGAPSIIPVGSTAVRAAIEKHQPILGLHGHIHESKAAVKIGRTLCINAGSEYGEGILRGALLVLNDGGVKNYQFTSG